MDNLTKLKIAFSAAYNVNLKSITQLAMPLAILTAFIGVKTD
jgi:hypothetical protein